jgi:hypothetical protein
VRDSLKFKKRSQQIIGTQNPIQIVLPSASTAETQPKLQPHCLSLSAISSQYFNASGV